MADKKYDIRLTVKDDLIPFGSGGDELYKPIYRICTNPNFVDNTDIGYLFKEGPDSIRKMRRETYGLVKAEFDKTDRADFAEFWNVNVNELTDLGFNKFVNNRGLKPIAHLIQCFQIIDEKPVYENKKTVRKMARKYISFGIDIDYLGPYLESLSKDQNNPCIPDVKKKIGRPRTKNANIYKEWRIYMGEDSEGKKTKMLKGSQTPLYEQFVEWCIVQGVQKKQGLEMALELLLDTYKVDGLTSIEELANRKKSIIDYIDTSDMNYTEYNIGKVKRDVHIGVEEFKLMMLILKNYNGSLESNRQGKIYASDMVTMALRYYFENRKDFTLRYGNPKAYEELMQIQKTKQYNEQVSKELTTEK